MSPSNQSEAKVGRNESTAMPATIIRLRRYAALTSQRAVLTRRAFK